MVTLVAAWAYTKIKDDVISLSFPKSMVELETGIVCSPLVHTLTKAKGHRNAVFAELLKTSQELRKLPYTSYLESQF